jgi:hypothetical protein
VIAADRSRFATAQLPPGERDAVARSGGARRELLEAVDALCAWVGDHVVGLGQQPRECRLGDGGASLVGICRSMSTRARLR